MRAKEDGSKRTRLTGKEKRCHHGHAKCDGKKCSPPPGRPVEWTPEINDDLIAFFSIEPYREVETITTGKNDYKKIEIKLIPNKVPFFGAFERKHDLTPSTLSRWAGNKDVEIKMPGFLGAYTRAKELQKEFLVNNGLAGLYPPASFVFTAKNITDMRDPTPGDSKTNPVHHIIRNRYTPEQAARILKNHASD